MTKSQSKEVPKDMVNAYGIEDVEKGKSQEMSINCCFQKPLKSSNHAKVKSTPELKTG